jgi:hypothetical protein
MKLDNGEFTVKMAAAVQGSPAFAPQMQEIRRDFCPSVEPARLLPEKHVAIGNP